MRLALLYNPRLLCERLAIASVRARRLAHLRGTPAAGLELGHIDSLELVALARDAGARVVYDIGANIGTWSLLAKSLIPDAEIHAFEPLVEHDAAFGKSFEGIAGVTLHEVALGSQDADATMHVTEFSDASSLLPPNALGASVPGMYEVGQRSIAVRRLDGYRRTHGLPLADFIKLDIQGYELEALRGAPECLGAAKAVLAEVSFMAYYENQCLFHDLVGHLASAGLLLTALAATTPTGRPLGQTDALFMRANAAAALA